MNDFPPFVLMDVVLIGVQSVLLIGAVLVLISAMVAFERSGILTRLLCGMRGHSWQAHHVVYDSWDGEADTWVVNERCPLCYSMRDRRRIGGLQGEEPAVVAVALSLMDEEAK